MTSPSPRRFPVLLAGLLALAAAPAPAATSFESPLSGAFRTNWFVLDFKDHGDGTNALDYMGGRQTYPTHTGIDIMLHDFLTLDEGVEVRAAAPGTVIRYVDGLDDRLLESQPNAIFLRHADGSVSYYAHLRKHSLLVATGQVVAAGQAMAMLGANGTNDVAHLHFGVLDRWATNGVWAEIMTNQFGLSQSFDWFDTYSNQVIRQVFAMGITRSNDPVFSLPAWRQQQTPSSYSLMRSGPFAVWIRYTGRTTNDALNMRLLSLDGPGATLDFNAVWRPSDYLRYHNLVWFSSWVHGSLSNGTTYALQYQWNHGEWQDAPGAGTLAVADDREEVFLARLSLPAYSNVPPAPRSLSASDGVHPFGVRLAWEAATNTIRYDVYRGLSSVTADASVIVRTSNTGFDDTNAAPGKVYTYWIKAVNAQGASAFSDPDTGHVRTARATGDYDGDGKSDLAVFDTTTGYWYIRTVAGAILAWGQEWGWPGVLPVEGDYNADGKSDLAVFDAGTGDWYIESLAGDTLAWAVPWGWPGALPVSGDYDGDRASDLAVFDTLSGRWYILSLAASDFGFLILDFGLDGWGMGSQAQTVNRQSKIQNPKWSSMIAWAVPWGWPGAVPVSGDYDGDGQSDLAVFDSNAGNWYVLSVDGQALVWAQPWGWPGAISAPGDYNGDGVSDLAVFDSNTGNWYVRSVAGQALVWAQPWGWPGAVPVPGDYNGDGKSDLAVFDSNTGNWYVLTADGVTVLVWATPWGWPGALPPGGRRGTP